MPIIEMHLAAGRTSEQKAAAAYAVTEALVNSLGVRVDAVRVLITEHHADGFYVAGQTLAQRAAAQAAAQAAATEAAAITEDAKR